ncbi:hypothetical protein VTK56DRAFT_1566 [Thermocarpiscus australiensis]
MEDARVFDRVQQLYHLGRGRDAAIVFLLDGGGIQAAMQPFMELHEKTMGTCSMPIIPLTSLDALPSALESFQASLIASTAAQLRPANATHDLLPYCTINSPLSRRSVDTLSRSCFSFRELLTGLATGEGQRTLRSLLEPADAELLLSFWTYEFATT